MVSCNINRRLEALAGVANVVLPACSPIGAGAVRKSRSMGPGAPISRDRQPAGRAAVITPTSPDFWRPFGAEL